jgi:hypothetical protein
MIADLRGTHKLGRWITAHVESEIDPSQGSDVRVESLYTPADNRMRLPFEGYADHLERPYTLVVAALCWREERCRRHPSRTLVADERRGSAQRAAKVDLPVHKT